MANRDPMKTRLKEAFNYLRTKQSLKQKDVAKLMGTSETTISRIINSAGDGHINTDFLIRLNEAVGKPFNIQYIIDGRGTLTTPGTSNLGTSPTESMQTAQLFDLTASLIKEVEALRAQLAQEIADTRNLRTQLSTMLKTISHHHGVEYSINHNYGYPAAVAEDSETNNT